ncbi:MAG: DUF4433 domain-containing protein [Candidatus Binatia bacterium]
MTREELDELHYITPISNVPSILEYGLLSHKGVSKLSHQSVAMSEIQDRRRKVVVPNARPLHEYVNLYICARNPMLSKRQAEHHTLCVLRVSPTVLDIPGVVIADRNASSDYARFAAAPRGLALVDRELVFAEWWKHPDDLIEEWRHKSIKCAEVLVPDHVAASYITGAYVSGTTGQTAFLAVAAGLAVTLNSYMFFR